MRAPRLLMLILIVCILGLLVKISEYRGDMVSTVQNIEPFDYQLNSISAPEFAAMLQLLSEQSFTESTWKK